jgi:hypothetical protein
MSGTEDSTVRRSLRRFVLGRGPLKRRSDRMQVLGRFVVVLSFLVSPPIAVAVTNATTVRLETVAEAEAAERSRAGAVLLEDAEPPAPFQSDYGDSSERGVPVRAVVTLPDGTSRDGTVMAPPRSPAGTSVKVWVDREGDVTRPPRDPAGIPATAAALAVLPLIGVPMATWILYALLTFALDAHRGRRWERDWAKVEPDWHSRLL